MAFLLGFNAHIKQTHNFRERERVSAAKCCFADCNHACFLFQLSNCLFACKERDEKDWNPNGKRNGLKEWREIHTIVGLTNAIPMALAYMEIGNFFKGPKQCPPSILKVK